MTWLRRQEIAKGPWQLCCAVLLLSIIEVGPVIAGDWTIVPRVSIDESYTDNVRLTQTDKLDDFITTVMPGMTIRGESNRLDLNLDYNLQYLKYADNTEFDDLFHQLQANGEFMLFKDMLFFTAGSRMSQQNTSNGNSFTPSNRSQTGNRTNVVQYEYGPEFRTSLRRWADVEASYIRNTNDRGRIGNVAATTVANTTADEEAVRVSIRSGEALARTPITVSYDDRDQQSANRDSRLRRLTGEVNYQVNRLLRFTAEGGREWNTFQTSRSNRQGPFWYVGGTLTPSARTTLTGRYGSRFFGKNFKIDASHRIRRFVFTFDYREDARTTNQIQSELELIPLTDAFGNPVLDAGAAADIESPLDVPSLNDDVVISRNISATMDYAGRRQNFNFRYFEGENSFEGVGRSETNRGISLNFQHQVTRVVSASLSGFWRESTNRGGDSETFRITPALRWSLGRHITANLNYEFIDGKAIDRNFTEHAVTGTFSYQF